MTPLPAVRLLRSLRMEALGSWRAKKDVDDLCQHIYSIKSRRQAHHPPKRHHSQLTLHAEKVLAVKEILFWSIYLVFWQGLAVHLQSLDVRHAKTLSAAGRAPLEYKVWSKEDSELGFALSPRGPIASGQSAELALQVVALAACSPKQICNSGKGRADSL